MSMGVRLDAAATCLLLIVGFGLGSEYVRSARAASAMPDMPGFSRRVFGAALMHACGRGLTTPVVATGSPSGQDELQPLSEFLSQKRESLDCKDLPFNIPTDGLDGMQRSSRYLIALASGTWRVTGPAWSGIDRLLGLLYGLSVALAFLVGRLAMSRAVAAGVAGMFLFSPLHLTNLVDLRDYARAPFLLVSLLIVALVAGRRRAPSVVLVLAAAGGAALGFGFGVRTDIAVNLISVLVAVVAFLPGRLDQTWRTRLLAGMVCLSSFAVVAAPIVGSRESGSNLWHWALLGYAHEWDDAMGIATGPYEVSYFYSDSYVATAVDAFWGRTTGATAQVSVGLPHYAEASRAYYLQIVRMFPADLLLRGWASTIKVLEMPYSGLQSIPGGVLPDSIQGFIGGLDGLLMRLAGAGLATFCVVVLAVSARDVRLATLLFGLVAFLGAYPAVQFQRRHFFHLQVLSLWFLGVAVSAGITAIVRLVRRESMPLESDKGPPASWRQPAVMALLVTAMVALPLLALRALQQRSVATMVSGYQAAKLEVVASSGVQQADGSVLVAGNLGPGPGQRGVRSMRTEMFVAEISDRGCPAERMSLTFRYQAKDSAVDFSRTYELVVPPEGQPTKVYFPAFETGLASPDPELLAFGGIAVPPSALPCLQRVSRFREPDTFPLLLPFVVPYNWQQLPLHQTLSGFEHRWNGLAVGAATWQPLPSSSIVTVDGANEPPPFQ